MKRFFQSTPGAKAGGLDGLNLFFGALLGANLGTLGQVPIKDYIKLVVLLAGTVMALRMVSTYEQRGRMFAVVAVYGALLASVVFVPSFRPAGISHADLLRLGATLAVWLAFVVLAEFTPQTSRMTETSLPGTRV